MKVRSTLPHAEGHAEPQGPAYPHFCKSLDYVWYILNYRWHITKLHVVYTWHIKQKLCFAL
jgi:hypothetical protein